MIPLSELLDRLGYAESPHYLPTNNPPNSETAHLFRAAQDAGVLGIYIFETSPSSDQRLLPARPIVYVAKATDEDEATRIHRSLWNLGYAPFLIIRLPNQIKIYTGFKYSSEDRDEGLLGEAKHVNQLLDLLKDFEAESIDTGRIWKSEYAEKLDSDQRVDKRLLKNLEQLGNALKKDGLRDEVAHALIGKYVYFSYLQHRGILSNDWLMQQQVNPQDVFTIQATILGLRTLAKVLEDRFNGKIFPIDFDKESTLKDAHVSWVAAIFSGAKIIDNAPEIVQQLHLPFQAYDFQYIPVETLSVIYEQFIYERKKKGAIYTPEVLADYLISEVESAKQLERGMKILDPSCGSGVFLVLFYRRLIEKQMNRLGRKLKPEELSDILQESIYGVERERDACYVTEFSLILTLLHYTEPRDLQNLKFQFPYLHNNKIFECDFFDVEGQQSEAKFWQQGLNFDCIVGNPPWIELTPKVKGEEFARTWMENLKNKSDRPIGGNRVAEAFSWLVTDLLKPNGIIGLILPATTLFNLESRFYRQQFFGKHEVLRITDFANLREVLFDGRATLPAATIIYRLITDIDAKSDIVHYGPFAINQVSSAQEKPWVITINENEIQAVSADEAASGETSVWKFALWGTYHDKRAIERIKYLFPIPLGELCDEKDWSFYEGAQLRNGNTDSDDQLKYIADLKDKKRFRSDLMRKSPLRFSIMTDVFADIPDEMCYIRKRGGEAGLKLTSAPHIVISPAWTSFVIFSDEDFVIPPRTMGIAASENDTRYLQALSLYLTSSLVSYYLFFHTQEWGIFRQAKRVSIAEVRKIPTPQFTSKQIEALVELHNDVVQNEKEQILELVKKFSKKVQRELGDNDSEHTEDVIELDWFVGLKGKDKKAVEQAISELRTKLQEIVDEKIYNLFKIPEDIRLLVSEFIQTRLPLDTPSIMEKATKEPTRQDLLAYGRELRNELNDFMMGTASHQITITHSRELIACMVEVSQKTAFASADEVSIKEADLTITALLAEVSDNLREQISQWVYVQRGLRLFEGPRVYIYKVPYLINWTRTQALNDAGDIIGQAIATVRNLHENN